MFVMICLIYLIPWLFKLKTEEDLQRQRVECYFLSWFTITNLESSKTATMFRLASSYLNLLIDSGILIAIAVICFKNPDIIIPGFSGIEGDEIVWKDLPLFPHINLVVGLVIISGVLSICLDLLLAGTWSEYKPIFCEGWKYFRQRGN